MNLSDEKTEKSQPPQASKTTLLLTAAIVICLAILAVFANVQRSRSDAVEAIKIRTTTSPTPKER